MMPNFSARGLFLPRPVAPCASAARRAGGGDPLRRVVQVFRPDGESTPLAGDDVVGLGDVILGCSFSVNELFAALRAR